MFRRTSWFRSVKWRWFRSFGESPVKRNDKAKSSKYRPLEAILLIWIFPRGKRITVPLFSLTVLKCPQDWGYSSYQDSKLPKSAWLKFKSHPNVLLNNLQTNIVMYFIIQQERQKGHRKDFPGSPVVKTPHLHCRGHSSIPGQGTKIPRAAWHGQKKKKKKGTGKRYLYKWAQPCLF